MGVMVIAVYKPRPGKEARLLECVRDHMPVLREEGLVTSRRAQTLRASDGTILEIFEWVSQEGVEAAHHNPAVQALWGRFAEACTYGTLSDLPGAKQVFAHFEPLDL